LGNARFRAPIFKAFLELPHSQAFLGAFAAFPGCLFPLCPSETLEDPHERR
jgi:hypothetical protein